MRCKACSALLGLGGLAIAPAGLERVADQMPGLGLGGGVTEGERQRLAAGRIGLGRVVLGEPYAAEFDPQEGVVRLDAQRPLEGCGGLAEVTTAGLVVGLSDQGRG